jgi:DNA-binding NarL/FixJ family response regulator
MLGGLSMVQVHQRAQSQDEQSAWPARADQPRAAALPHRNLSDLLTVREASVLTMIAEGLTNREVSLALGISVRTVEFHRRNLMRKVDVKNIAELMRIFFGYPSARRR